MNKTIIITAFILISTAYSQTVTLGVRTEVVLYSVYHTHSKDIGIGGVPPPMDAYLKAGIQYKKFSLDFRGGLLMGDPFFGGEFGAALKYNHTEKSTFLVAWLEHLNGAGDGNSGGNYVAPINFIGIGFETKITQLFGLDWVLYFPVGNNNLQFSRDFYDPDILIVASRVGPVLRFGFIFDIIRI